MITWRIDAQTAAGNEDDMARPSWLGEVPWCDEQCPHHDGKRCRVLGLRPDRLCEPVVKQMAVMLSAGPAPHAPRQDQLTDDELNEIEQRLGPSLKLTALVAEVRERRRAR